MRQAKVNGTNTKIVTLDNGLTVIMIHDPKADTISACVGVRYGGAYENPGSEGAAEKLMTGISHLLEHVVLRGTKERSAIDTWKGFRRFTTEDCAETDFEKTMYYFETDRQHFSQKLGILADTIKNAAIAGSSVNDEKKVVVIEKLERDESAETKAFDMVYDLAVEGKEGAESTIGSRETINNIDRDKLVQAYNDNYKPDNAVVAICGSLSQNDMLRKAKKYFGDWKGKAKPRVVSQKFKPEISGRDIVRVNNGSETVSVTYAFEILPAKVLRSKREHMALELISYELKDRLEWAMRLTNGTGTIYHPWIVHDYGREHGLFVVNIKMDPLAGDVEKAKQLLHEELRRTFRGEITKKDLIDHRDSIGIRRIARDTAHNTCDQAIHSLKYFMDTGSPHYHEKFLKELKKITPEYMRKVAAKYLDPDRAMRYTIVPQGYLPAESGTMSDGAGI